MSLESKAKTAGSIALGALACASVVFILWLDITTGVWQDLVILSGLAAGLVSFVFTALVVNRIMVRGTERRWAPVNRLAFSEFLHTLADEDTSEVARGLIVARTLTFPFPIETAGSTYDTPPLDDLHALREQIVVERKSLTEALSRWAQFLASSGNNEAVLQHVAAIAWRFDEVRDATLDAEGDWNAETHTLLVQRIDATNQDLAGLVAELESRLQR